MTKFDLIKELVALVDDFDDANKGDISKDTFFLWVNEKKINEGKKLEANLDKEISTEFSEWRISYFISLISKYAKTYIKKALQDAPLVSLDDFGYLITLCYEGSKTKTELIQSNVGEVSSGMEIIKRLEKKQLIKSFQDTQDRRATRLAATAKGQTVLAEAMKEMYKASNIIAGNLNTEERLYLLTVLNKLHQFHNPIYLNESKTDLMEIRERYLASSVE